MEKTKKLGLVGRCLLGGSMLVGGCTESLTSVQEQGMYNLMGLGYDYTMQQERNKAIRESKSEVNVYVGENQHYKSYSMSIEVEQYDENWKGSAVFPLLKRNDKTKQFAPKPGYVWENPNDTKNFRVIPITDHNEIKDYEIKPKRYPEVINVKDFKFN